MNRIDWVVSDIGLSVVKLVWKWSTLPYLKLPWIFSILVNIGRFDSDKWSHNLPKVALSANVYLVIMFVI